MQTTIWLTSAPQGFQPQPQGAQGEHALPLSVLLKGSAPALCRTITTGAVTAPNGQEARLVPIVGRQVADQLEAKAVSALHCPWCDQWLSSPVTLPCGHSFCRAHISSGQTADTTFVIGQRALRRDTGQSWGVGYVTSVEPLRVTLEDDPNDYAVCWDEVRSMIMPTTTSQNQVETVADSGVGCTICAVCNCSGRGVRDFMLEDCINILVPSPIGRSQLSKSSAPALARSISEMGRALFNSAIILPQGDDRHLFCAVCLERFPEPQRYPLLLTCGHTLCSQCVQYIKQKSRKCPLCKANLLDQPRPSTVLRTALGFINTLPIARGVSNLAQGTQDLQELQSAVQSFRREIASTRIRPFHWALQTGDHSAVVDYLKVGVDCNALDGTTGQGSLHAAALAGRFEFVDMLLKAAADPSLQRNGGETPLLLVCSAEACSAHSSPARCNAIHAMLRDRGDGKDRLAACLGTTGNATPLLRAVQKLVFMSNSVFSAPTGIEDEVALVHLLVEKGADPSAADIFGISPASEVQRSIRPNIRELFAH